MDYTVIDTGQSRSFPEGDAFLDGHRPDSDVLVFIGTAVGPALQRACNLQERAAILVELDNNCLGVHVDEHDDLGHNVLGFARFRLGSAAPTNLIEMVRRPQTSPSALDAAKSVFEKAGLSVAVCNDFAGRIIDRLVRPVYNGVLRRLDEGLASAEDIDLTLRLGLGYPEGLIALVERTGLASHFDVTQTLYEAYGEQAYVAARRARIAKQRSEVADASS